MVETLSRGEGFTLMYNFGPLLKGRLAMVEKGTPTGFTTEQEMKTAVPSD